MHLVCKKNLNALEKKRLGQILLTTYSKTTEILFFKCDASVYFLGWK